MTACFYPINFESVNLPNKKERFRYIDYIKLFYYIEKSNVDDIMRKILSEHCDVSVIGYDKYSDKFLCKKYGKNSCELHIEIKIINKGRNCSLVKIIPLVGVDTNIKKFVLAVDKCLRLCQTSKYLNRYQPL